MTSAYVNGKKSTYSYRPDGLRINKMVDGVRTRHVLDGQNVSMDLNDDWSTKFSFIRGVRLVGYIDGANGSKYFYNFNAHGDVLGAVGGLNSTAQTRYTYDAFGNSSKTGTSENPFGYFGQYHDAETGLIYLRARYYDPNAGRFISEDPVRDGMNWYAYAANNPVTFVDPTGLVIQFNGVVDKDDVRFKTLQDLTDDELYLEYDEINNVTYVRYTMNKAARRMTGTSLVRRVIDHKRTCKIIDTNCMTGYTYHTSHEGAQTPGVGSDVLIDLDFDSPGKYYVVRNRKVQEEIGKTFIELGHELIHALRAMNGNMKFDKYGVYGTPWRAWSFFGFQFDTTATADQDELDTVGINYNGEEGGHYPASEWQMTENALRKENGEPPRVTY